MTLFDQKADYKMDTCGLFCPEPVMLLHNKIDDLKSGELLELIATDPSTQRDIPKFCQFLGHELVKNITHEQRYYFLIRKGA